MALHGCSNCVVVTAALALLLFPVQYYVPDFYTSEEERINGQEESESPPIFNSFDFPLLHLPPIDLFVTLSLVILGMLTYLWEWIQRKVMERRIIKLNQYLCESVEQLRVLDAQQEQQEATLKMVQNATSEYNLLLYLLLRQHRSFALGDHHETPSKCFFEKGLDDDIALLRNPMQEA